MRIPFDIKYRPQIESGEYKVETRDGEPVRIVCWDKQGECPIVVVSERINDDGVYTYHKNGHYTSCEDGRYDLFIVTPEEEMTEFEQVLKSGTNIYVEQGRRMEDWDAKQDAKELLSLARKELQPEIDAAVEKAYKNADEVMYRKGKEDGIAEARNDITARIIALKQAKDRAEEALKDLPRWREWGNGVAGNGDGHPIALVSGAGGIRFVSVLGVTGEKYIMLDELKKLPGFKEDEK